MSRSPIEVGCEIVAALTKGPRTANELAEMVGCTRDSADRWINGLSAAGMVKKNVAKRDTGSRKRPAIHAWQGTPFAMEDAQP